MPQRVHRAARRWARREAAQRLERERRPRRRRARAAAGGGGRPRRLRRRAAGRRRARRAPPLHEIVACPFKGLASFEVDDAEVFFGRERLVAEMVARLAGAPLLGIVGPSGSGKSSALRGRPAARARNRTCCPAAAAGRSRCMRPGAHPLAALEQAVAQAAPEGRLVIAVDQFEELFTACRDEAERAAFADALVAAVRDPRRRALVLIALRADFYGRCASLPRAVAHARRQPRAGRADAPRRAAPRDRAARPARRPARRARARRRADRRRRGRARRAAAALDRAARAVAAPRRAPPAPRRLRARRRRPRRGRAAGRARLRAARPRAAPRRAQAILVRLAGRRRGRARSCAGGCRSPSSSARRARARCSPRSPTAGS